MIPCVQSAQAARAVFGEIFSPFPQADRPVHRTGALRDTGERGRSDRAKRNSRSVAKAYLASWVKALREGFSAKKVEDRLSRNLSLEGMDRKIQEIVMQDSRGCVKEDTRTRLRALRVRLRRMFPLKRASSVHPSSSTDVCKENARKMQYVYKVRDASRSKENGEPQLVNGYARCMDIACNSGNKRIIPLHFSLWSTIAPDYHSENAGVMRILDRIRSVHGTNGIYVYDRGGDNIELFRYFVRNELNFIVRLKRRNLVS